MKTLNKILTSRNEKFNLVVLTTDELQGSECTTFGVFAVASRHHLLVPEPKQVDEIRSMFVPKDAEDLAGVWVLVAIDQDAVRIICGAVGNDDKENYEFETEGTNPNYEWKIRAGFIFLQRINP